MRASRPGSCATCSRTPPTTRRLPARLFPRAYLDPTAETEEAEWQALVGPSLLRERLRRARAHHRHAGPRPARRRLVADRPHAPTRCTRGSACSTTRGWCWGRCLGVTEEERELDPGGSRGGAVRALPSGSPGCRTAWWNSCCERSLAGCRHPPRAAGWFHRAVVAGEIASCTPNGRSVGSWYASRVWRDDPPSIPRCRCSGGGSCRVFGSWLRGCARRPPGSRPTVGQLADCVAIARGLGAGGEGVRGRRRCVRRACTRVQCAGSRVGGAVVGVYAVGGAGGVGNGEGAPAACSATNEALTAGSLSLAQAAEIVQAEAAVPGSEDALLEVAATQGMAGLRSEARRVALGAIHRQELHRRQRAARSGCSTGSTTRGWWRAGSGCRPRWACRSSTDSTPRPTVQSAPPAVPERRGPRDPLRRRPDADGEGWGKGRAARADVVYVCDLPAAVRGHTHGDELCHVIGGGPVSVDVVRARRSTCSSRWCCVTGRRSTRSPMTDVTSPRGCGPCSSSVIPSGSTVRCASRTGAIVATSSSGTTTIPSRTTGSRATRTEARCRPDHWAKTERDRTAGLLGETRWEWGPP